jgi:ABC-type uncharacterized transport system involved in gliding motility auxiliary subunit
VSWGDRFQKRKMLYGAGSAVSVLLVVGILILASLFAHWHPVRWDLTRGKTQSLSPVSKALLKQITKPLTMTVFLPEGSGERQSAKEVVQLYAFNNPHVSYHFVDPEREPLKAKAAGYRYAGNVLLDYQGRQRMADIPDENAITNALRKVLKVERKKVYFLAGHGERSLDDPKPGGFQVAQKALENEGYVVAPLNLLTQGAIPKDAAVVVIAAPKKPLLGTEIETLKGFMADGGRVLVMLDAFDDGGLKDFLSGYGVDLDNGLILDVNQVSQAMGLSAVMPIVSQYGPSKITRDFKNIVTIYPMARPLFLKKDLPGVTLLPLATTMSTSYEKLGKAWIKANQAGFDPKTDKKGPFVLAAQAEIKPVMQPPAAQTQAAGKNPKPAPVAKKNPPAKSEGYMVVFGDVEFAGNSFFNLFGNGDFFLNTVNFLANAMGQITVRTASKAQLLTLKTGEAWWLFLASLVWGPLIMLIAGIWAYRRRRRARR